jgi:hypothetical protein
MDNYVPPSHSLAMRHPRLTNRKRSWWNSIGAGATVVPIESGRVQFFSGSQAMFQVSNTVRRTKTEDGGVLLDIHHGRMFCLNIVGAKILDLLEKGFETREIAAEVSDAYAMDIKTVQADVLDFIEVLNKHHILQVRASGAFTERVSPL